MQLIQPCHAQFEKLFSDLAMLLIFLLGSVGAMVEPNLDRVADEEDGSRVVGGERRHHADNHFDLLIFTQHWPYTTCLDWEEKRHGSCNKIGIIRSVHLGSISRTQVGLPGASMGCGQRSFIKSVKTKILLFCLILQHGTFQPKIHKRLYYMSLSYIYSESEMK